MTDDQYKKAQELYKQRDYYKDLARKVADAQETKAYKDADSKKRLKTTPYDSNAKWTLMKYFRVRFWNRPLPNEDGLPSNKKVPTIGVLPHWEFAREIEIDADDELISLIRLWLEDKATKLEEEIQKV